MKYCNIVSHYFPHRLRTIRANLSLTTAQRHKRGKVTYLRSFVISVLHGGEWTTSRHGRCNLEKKKNYFLLTEGCVNQASGLDDLEKTKTSAVFPEFETLALSNLCLFTMRALQSRLQTFRENRDKS
jgi:hypothetical protein